MDSLLPKKTEDAKKDQRHVLVLFAMTKLRKKSKQQTDPRGEDKNEKQHKPRMSIRNVDISV